MVWHGMIWHGMVSYCIIWYRWCCGIIVSLLPLDACERVADKLRKVGTTVYTYKCDLADKDNVYSTAKKVEEEVGHVTILINNAGIQFASTFLNSSDEELKKQVDVNTIAHFWVKTKF